MKHEDYHTPSGRPCPHPGMTDDDLDDFEEWDRTQRRRSIVPEVLGLLVIFLLVVLVVISI